MQLEPFLKVSRPWAHMEYFVSAEHNGVEVLATFTDEAQTQSFGDIPRSMVLCTSRPGLAVRCTLYDGNGFETKFTLTDAEHAACQNALGCNLRPVGGSI